MSTFFEVIKARFEADAALTAAGLTKLYQARVPDGDDPPYCVFDTDGEEKTANSFAVKFHDGSFTFKVAGSSKEVCTPLRDKIVAAFKDAEKDLTVTGISVSLLEETETSYDEVEPGLWTVDVQYEYKYSEAR